MPFSEKNIEVKRNDARCLDMFSNSCTFVLTSPPYNRKRNDKYTEYNDNITNYFEFLTEITDILLQKTKKFVFMNLQADFYNRKDIYKYIGQYADKIQNIIVWEKTNPTPAAGNSITNAYEYIIVLGDFSLKSNTTYTKNHITTNVCKNEYHKVHKAVMNEEISDLIIEKFTQENELILDPTTYILNIDKSGLSVWEGGLRAYRAQTRG